jgi:hypothetical protein
VTESAYEKLRRLALNQDGSESSRHAAIEKLADPRTRDAAEVLLELGARQDETASILWLQAPASTTTKRPPGRTIEPLLLDIENLGCLLR